MREIKFRIWNEETADFTSIESSLIMLEELNDLRPHLKVEQYTGLKDKTGTEIYDGDIICIYDNTGSQQKYVLEYREDIYQIVGIGGPGEWMFLEEFEGCELIGNIHSNPTQKLT